MISEEQLRIAAKETHAQYIEALLNSGDLYAPHTFSPEFERKMEKLINSIGKRSLRRVLQKVACFFLALIASASVWLSVDAEARSKVFGWVKEVCGELFIYRFQSSSKDEANVSEKEYCITRIPEGYALWSKWLDGEIDYIIYANENGDMLSFAYTQNLANSTWGIDVSMMETLNCSVSGHEAKALVSLADDVSNSVIWTGSDNTAFYISAFLDVEELVKIAESVQPLEK